MRRETYLGGTGAPLTSAPAVTVVVAVIVTCTVDIAPVTSPVEAGHRYVSVMAWPWTMAGAVQSSGSAGHSSRAARGLAEAAAAAVFSLACDLLVVYWMILRSP
jgi:hypothetical protein